MAGSGSRSRRQGSGGEASGTDLEAALSEAVALQRGGKTRLAAIKYQKILDQHPDSADALHNLGMLRAAAGDLADALVLLDRAVAARPGQPGFSYNLGNVQMAAGRSDEAEASYRRAIATRPDYPEAHVHLANCLIGQNKLDDALTAARRAVELKPDLAPGWLTLGNVHWRRRDLANAIGAFGKAIELRPEYAEAYSNLGTLYRELGRAEEALSCLQRAVHLAPNLDFEAVGNLVYLELSVCAWEDLDSLSRRLAKEGGGQKKALTPFSQLARSDDPAEALAVAKRWFGDVGATAQPLWRSRPTERRATASVTVGYLSSDFRDHPVGRLTAPLFALHDRTRFRVLVFSHGVDDGSDPRRAIAEAADGFFDLRECDDHAAACRIAEQGVDILVDLNGLTSDHRIGICGMRPAPVQAVYLGFPGTTGASCFDYIITDPVVSPLDHARYYSEALAQMPHSFMPSGNFQVPEPAARRAALGLPELATVFCSFNQAYKIDRTIFTVWTQILAEVEESVLWLSDSSPLAVRNLRNAAASAGIDPDRLIFAPHVATHAAHLARLQQADVALDPRFYNGHATSVDLMWAGVPLVTVQGRHFASRVSSSLLAAAGLSDLITGSLADYKALAVDLAREPAKRKVIRDRLTAARATAPFFDCAKNVGALESLYMRMHALARAGGAPCAISAA